MKGTWAVLLSVVAGNAFGQAEPPPKRTILSPEPAKPERPAEGVKSRDQARRVLIRRREEAQSLGKQAREITVQIGELAASGKLPDDKSAVDQMQELVDQLKAINARLEKIENDIDAILSWIEGQNESLPVLTADVANLKRRREGTYLVFQYSDTNRKGANPGDVPYDAFRMREVRFSTTYTLDPRTSFRLSFDAAAGTNQSQFFLRDAFMTLDLEPSNQNVGKQLTFGQQPLPLGFELERSNTSREFPERAAYNQVLFNAERSRGVRYRQGLGKNALFDVGVFNALTIGDPEQRELSAGSGNKLGVLAGVRYFDRALDLGISGFVAERPTYFRDGGRSPEVDDRRFLFLDGTYVLTPQLKVRGEAMFGHDRVPSANPDPNRKGNDLDGWQLQLTYSPNPRNQFSARFERFDPNRSRDNDLQQGFGLAWNYLVTPNVRFTLAQEWFEDDARAGRSSIDRQRRFHLTTIRVHYRF